VSVSSPSSQMETQLKKEKPDKTSSPQNALAGGIKEVKSYTIYEIKNYRTKRENYKSYTGSLREVVDVLDNDRSYHEIIKEDDLITLNIDIETYEFNFATFEMYLFSYLISSFQGDSLIDKFAISYSENTSKFDKNGTKMVSFILQ